MPTRPQPGTAAFAAALLARLQADPGAGRDAAIEGVRASSRNTLIYTARTRGGRFICKAAVGSRSVDPKLEYDMLVDLRARLAGSPYGCIQALAVYPELGVLVTRLEPGATVRKHIDEGLRARGGSAERRFAEGLMDPCAGCLFQFHQAFGLERGAAGAEQAFSYVDIHPRNLLVPPAPGASLVMLDPPHKLRLRPVHFDLATFCFALARIGFTPLALVRRPQAWLDGLKAAFLAGYFRRLGRAPGAADLARLQAFEAERARRARHRYGQYRQYGNWPLELARMAYFAPVMRAYVAFQLPASYRRIARAIQSGSAGS